MIFLPDPKKVISFWIASGLTAGVIAHFIPPPVRKTLGADDFKRAAYESLKTAPSYSTGQFFDFKVGIYFGDVLWERYFLKIDRENFLQCATFYGPVTRYEPVNLDSPVSAPICRSLPHRLSPPNWRLSAKSFGD